MTKTWISTILTIALFLVLSVTAFAADAPRLCDEADVLTDAEESALLASLDSVSEQYGVDVAVVTVDTIGDDTVDHYAECVYYDYGYGRGDEQSGILLLVTMAEREYCIYTEGDGTVAVTGAEGDGIGETIAPFLSVEDYATAFDMFVDECVYQVDGMINGFPFKFFRNLLISLVIGFVVALIVTGVMRGQLKSVRKQPEATVYTKPGSMKVTVANDFFLYRTVNRRKKEKNNSGGGSSRNVSVGKF